MINHYWNHYSPLYNIINPLIKPAITPIKNSQHRDFWGLPASSWHRGPRPCPPPCPPSLASRPNPRRKPWENHGKNGKTMEKMGKKMGKPWDKMGKKMGKRLGKDGKTMGKNGKTMWKMGKPWENHGEKWENHGKRWENHDFSVENQRKTHWKLPKLWFCLNSSNGSSHHKTVTETSWLRWFSLCEYGELCLSCLTMVYISWILVLFFVLFLHPTHHLLSRRISWTMCSMKRCTSCFVSIFCFLSSFCRLSMVFFRIFGLGVGAGQSGKRNGCSGCWKFVPLFGQV